MTDKAIRAAKLTAAGILDKARARTAVTRAGGQIAPSKYLPNVPRQVHADGGRENGMMGDNGGPPLSEPPIDLGAAREQKQVQTFHKGLMGGIASAASERMEAHQKALDAGVFDGYEVGDTLQGRAHPLRITGRFVRPWKPNRMTLEHFDRMGAKPTIIEHNDKQYIPMLRYQTGKEGVDGFQEGDVYLDGVKAAGYQKMGGLRAVKADGGKVGFLAGNHPLVPEVLYHGTARDIQSFDPDAKRSYDVDPSNPEETDTGWFGKGHYFTASPKLAGHYASEGAKRQGGQGANVLPAHVAMKNPFVVDMKAYDSGAKSLDSALSRAGVPMHPRGWRKPSEQTAALVGMGHDGVIATREGKPEEYVAFHPTQIKSAISARQFDPNDPDITKSEGGPIDEQGIEAPAARLGDGTQAGGLPLAGGVRGGEGVLSAPLPAHSEVNLTGLPTNIKIPKLGMSIVAGHNPVIRQVARDYAKTAGIDYSPPTLYKKVDPDLGTRISHAYENMAHVPDHPLVKAAYDALKQETLAQYRAAKAAGLKMEFYPDHTKDPYHSQPRLMSEDVNQNNHMYVYPTNAGFGTGEQPEGHENNPLLGDSGERWNGQPVMFNDLFRAVHDYYGHVKEGLGFRGDGEENAWRSHSAMYSPLARIALGAETRGQNSLLNYGPNGEHNRSASTEDTIFSPQKLGILPVWAHHEGAEFIRPEERDQMEAIYKSFGVGPEGLVGPDIRKPMSIFPKPQRMFPEDQRPAGGQYLSAHNKADVTGHKAEAATIGVAPGGKPFFRASQNAVEQTGTPGRGSATVKTNLFKQKAGWKWQDVPEGHEKTDTIVSVEHRGKHIYALNSHFPRGVDLTRYENAPSEPRLRPTTKGNVTLGPQAGSISVRGKLHPVYHHVIVKADGGAVDAALAATRRFTKDGKAATLALKPKGK